MNKVKIKLLAAVGLEGKHNPAGAVVDVAPGIARDLLGRQPAAATLDLKADAKAKADADADAEAKAKAKAKAAAAK